MRGFDCMSVPYKNSSIRRKAQHEDEPTPPAVFKSMRQSKLSAIDQFRNVSRCCKPTTREARMILDVKMLCCPVGAWYPAQLQRLQLLLQLMHATDSSNAKICLLPDATTATVCCNGVSLLTLRCVTQRIERRCCRKFVTRKISYRRYCLSTYLTGTATNYLPTQ